MDNETKKVLSNQDILRELVGHQGWPILRSLIAEKILDLQDAFKIDDRTATTMLNDLRARKKAAQILFDVLQEVEGTATQAEDNAVLNSNRKHIYIKED